jgi:hypothetical protein
LWSPLWHLPRYLRGGGNPALSVFEFNTIRKRFFENLEREVAGGKFDEVFVSRALQNRANAQDSWPT